MPRLKRLNHAVFFVSDVGRSVRFYEEVLGFRVIAGSEGEGALFLRGSASQNHHDLGLFRARPGGSPSIRGTAGLYHLAWEVERIEDLIEVQQRLTALGALIGQSDHAVSKSLYARDPDGNEFEVMWATPREAWPEDDRQAVTQPLDLAAEVARWGAANAANPVPSTGSND